MRAFLILLFATTAAAQPMRVERGPFVSTQIESGEVRAVRSTDLEAPGDWRSEPLIVFLAPEGVRAAAGDTLVRFDTADILEEIQAAAAEVERREAELLAKRAEQAKGLASLRSSVRNAEFAAEQAELREQQLEFAAEIERQTARLSLERARLQRTEAGAKLEARAVLDSLELVQLETGLVQARTALERERAQLERMILIAPAPGLVIHGEAGDDDRKVREGDRVSAGEVVVRLPDLDELEVAVGVHERDRVHVREGQPVRVGFDAFDDLWIDGRVQRIAQLATAAQRRSRIQRFEVVIGLDGSDPRLRPGMTARAEIEIGRTEDALIVPRTALAARGDRTFVTTADGDEIDVVIGHVSPTIVELVDGPAAGTALRSPAPSAPEDRP